MRIPKAVLVLLIGALLVTSVGFVFLATRPEGEKTVFTSQDGPVPRSQVSNLVNKGKVVPTMVIERHKAVGLLGEGEEAFVLEGNQSGPPVVILAPGHADYVKNSITALSDHKQWIEVE